MITLVGTGAQETYRTSQQALVPSVLAPTHLARHSRSNPPYDAMDQLHAKISEDEERKRTPNAMLNGRLPTVLKFRNRVSNFMVPFGKSSIRLNLQQISA